ncbi:hypothetical protein B0T19DRAFT_428721 [Cercophora scortea]|uniref:Uncharacterized protein n=1 Tax=Cercophora scortea TaxID=314031 RepID=A0AAE0MAG0_9PEZI|nr:hypothetical protein B0T19DRAFT_428721 [Cercophora scortea]
MSDSTLLSALSAYPAVIALLPAVAALLLTDRGWNAVSTTARRTRATVRPSEGTCSRRFWADLADGQLHVCTNAPWPAQCHGQVHVRGKTCWERTLTAVLNHWISSDPELEPKPSGLPLSKEFLHVDASIIRAFIIMATQDNWLPHRVSPDARDVHIGDVVINRQVVKRPDGERDIVVLHLQGQLRRTLSKDHLQRLLDGGPPLSRDPWGQSIFSNDDISRGGWIVAIGLESTWDSRKAFVPVYIDSVQYKGQRGSLFWRSIDRVTHMLSDIWLPAFEGTSPAGDKVKKAIEALKFMRERETESGAQNIFNASLPTTPTSAQKRLIIDHFNGPPILAESSFPQFRNEWEPLLSMVLAAAVEGTTRCLAYFKNPGREMHLLMPNDVLDSGDLYIRGC